MIILTATLVILHITKTESNNCFVIDFKPQIINIARKTIKNKFLVRLHGEYNILVKLYGNTT